MATKYIDNMAILQVIGCVYKDLSILDKEDKYVITEHDFSDEFHKITFGAIYKLHELGVKKMSIEAIEEFLESRPKSKGVFNANKGVEYLNRVMQCADLMTFDYYYNRLKKMSLLRAYNNIGIDLTEFYDPDEILDLKKKQRQEEWLDTVDLEKIASIVNDKIDTIKAEYVENDVFGEAIQAGTGIKDLIKKLEETPDVGVPLYGDFINTITRGARLGKFYLRSAPSGIGKTRSMVADACYIACDRIYDETFGWIKNGQAFPTLFVATEQDLSEIQTLMLAFLSNVDEDHILRGQYEEGERERVFEAADVIERSPLFIEELPEFNLQDVENVIQRNIRDNHIKYVFHDYIHTSIKILEEITKRAGKIALREDNVLFMLSARMKEICVKYGVFMMSATQLNSDYQESKTPDQNLLRGAKAIADKIDYGSVLLPVTETDLASLENVIAKNPAWCGPNIKMSIYKNRRGRYKSVYLWCRADLGTCRVNPMFMTNWQYELQSIENIKVEFKEPSAFEDDGK